MMNVIKKPWLWIAVVLVVVAIFAWRCSSGFPGMMHCMTGGMMGEEMMDEEMMDEEMMDEEKKTDG